MNEKVQYYVRSCWDRYRCADKDEVDKIIQEVINENPNETDWVKLGVKAKRKCQAELTK